jgi:Bacterial antitoxin of ParD toxin-antitoxin type II system and RHH
VAGPELAVRAYRNLTLSVILWYSTSMNIFLTHDLEQFVTAKVKSGRYTSASEVIRAGVRLLVERDGVTVSSG